MLQDWNFDIQVVQSPSFTPISARPVLVLMMCNPDELPAMPDGWQHVDTDSGCMLDPAVSWPEALGQVLGVIQVQIILDAVQRFGAVTRV